MNSFFHGLKLEAARSREWPIRGITLSRETFLIAAVKNQRRGRFFSDPKVYAGLSAGMLRNPPPPLGCS
jgi:hypothetical protein